MYFKYNWSCICILRFCKSEILFQNTLQVKLGYVPCYGRNVTKLNFLTVLISATLGTSISTSQQSVYFLDLMLLFLRQSRWNFFQRCLNSYSTSQQA